MKRWLTIQVYDSASQSTSAGATISVKTDMRGSGLFSFPRVTGDIWVSHSCRWVDPTCCIFNDNSYRTRYHHFQMTIMTSQNTTSYSCFSKSWKSFLFTQTKIIYSFCVAKSGSEVSHGLAYMKCLALLKEWASLFIQETFFSKSIYEYMQYIRDRTIGKC